MITGRGDIIDVSATSYPDLFWGMRGAGFNFGIVTEAVYTVYDFTNNGQATNADFIIKGSDNASVWEYLKSYESDQPDNIGFEFGIGYNESFGGVSLSQPTFPLLPLPSSPTNPPSKRPTSSST